MIVDNQKLKAGSGEKEYSVTVIEIGNEKVLYVGLPYSGCTKNPKCLFCGVQEKRNRLLTHDTAFDREVFSTAAELISKYLPDTLVLYIGGNILRPQEMSQSVITENIPELISTHPICNAYEIEVRADDILNFSGSIKKIKSVLGEKELRVRIGIEYFDDKLLSRHRKGITTRQIVSAVGFLNQLNIRWNGYAMLGGLDFDQYAARMSAERTAKFMIDNGAYKVSLNGMFTTQKLEKSFGKRIYVPEYADLIAVLKKLLQYRESNKKTVLFKIGFEEEDMKNVVRMPYVSADIKVREIIEKMFIFNKTQNVKVLE